MTSVSTKAPAAPFDTSSLPAHLPALDGLRGLAILLVLAHMLNLLAPQTDMVGLLFSHFSYFGWTGVQLFFVLSGFLITGILIDTQKAQNYFSGFYARRTLRIFPLYFAVLAVAFIVLPAIGSVPPKIAIDQENQVWLWTYLSNWASALGVGSKAFPHFWSLAVEEQFYLLWPLLIRSRSPRQCVWFCVGIAVASLLLRCVLAWAGTSDTSIYENSFCRMDALALGGAAAAAFRIPAWRDRLVAMHNRLLTWSVILTLAGLVLTHGFWNGTLVGETIGYTIVALMFVLLLMAAAGADAAGASGWADLLRLRPLRAVGKYSYAMYIFHKPLHDYVGKPMVMSLNPQVTQSVLANVAYIAVGIVVTFAAAFVSWHLFEKHFLQMKRLFAPQP